MSKKLKRTARRHSNTDGRRQIARGKTRKFAEILERELGIKPSRITRSKSEQ